jgi:hypothetical protein
MLGANDAETLRRVAMIAEHLLDNSGPAEPTGRYVGKPTTTKISVNNSARFLGHRALAPLREVAKRIGETQVVG